MKIYFSILCLLLFISSCHPKTSTSTTTTTTSTSTSSIAKEAKPIVTATKMNVLYIGVDNPITIETPGLAPENVKVSCKGGLISSQGKGKYNVVVQVPGKVEIYVRTSDTEVYTYAYRAKQIPNPVVRLGGLKKNEITKAELRIDNALYPWLEDFDFDARCVVDSFKITRIPPIGERQTLINSDRRFQKEVITLLDQAEEGDIYLFEKVVGRCPGLEQVERRFNDLIFRIIVAE